MIITDTLNLETNVVLTLRDALTGEIAERQVHNLYLNYGREWLLKLMSYAAAGYPMENNRVCFVGLGIGGNKQTATIEPNLNAVYPGTNSQSGSDLTVTYLERPVMVKEVGADDYWLKEITHASTTVTTSAPYYAQYICNFTETEISYAPYYVVPLSEAGLFDYGQEPYMIEPIVNVYATTPVGRGQPIAYCTFYPLSKTTAVTLQIKWQVRLA